MTKTKSGLYPEFFSAALQKHVHLPVRSERQRDVLDIYVDNQQLDLIKNPDWQVIYGRRGTGKTILLSVLKEQCNKDFEKSRILAVSVTAQDLLVSPVGTLVSDRQRALGYFQVFLESIAEQLVSKVDELLGSPSFIERVLFSRKRLIDRIQDTALQILSLVQTGQPVDAYVKRKETREKKNGETQTLRLSGDLEVDVGINGVSGSAKGSTNKSDEQVLERNTTTQEEHASVPRFALARAKILDLLRDLKVQHLDILIDEWQTLDPHAATGIQPEFAEYLKRTFAGAPEISVKIATNRYQTRFSNRRAGGAYRGLEVGADIFEATNLDRTEQSLNEQFQFYSTLLYKRLVHCEPALSVFDTGGEGIPNEQFIVSLFRNERAFYELVKGAPATPRDFLLLFNTLAKARTFRNSPTWNIPMVHEAVREGGANLQEETDSSSEADQLLTRCIKAVVEKTQSRLFLVDRDDRYGANTAIEELIEKRLIDPYAKAELDPVIRTKYDAFLLHYGLWLDWRPLDVTTEVYEKREIPDIAEDDAILFKVELSEIDSDGCCCSNCGDHFSCRTRSYQVAGLCPSCFKPVTKSQNVMEIQES